MRRPGPGTAAPSSMPSRWRAALLVALLLGVTPALASTAALRAEVDELRVALDRLRQEQADLRARIDAAGAARPRLESDLAALRTRLDGLEAQVRAIAEHQTGSDQRLEGLAAGSARVLERLEALERRAAAGTPGPVPGAPGGASAPATGVTATGPLSGGGAGDDPAEAYRKAYADYTAGHYDLAGLGFSQVLEQAPRGPLADDAVYWLAEIEAAGGRGDRAIAGFSRVISEYPEGDRVPAATLRKGLLLIEANRIGEGVLQLDHLVRKHPSTDEARLARNKLRALGVAP